MLSVENLSVAINGTDILENISFKVNKGEYVSIVGENGSGKSTLVKTILGQVPKKSGSVVFDDFVGRIGYLPQQIQIKNFPASCFEVVLSGCLGALKTPFFTKKEKEYALNNMKKLGIEFLAKKKFTYLSGGEKQRVLLARAMCAGENMLILDEPVTGLDPLVTEEMYKIIKKLNEEDNVTVLMVSHDIVQASKYSSKILHIGKTVRFFGTSEEYISSEIGIHFTGRCCHV